MSEFVEYLQDVFNEFGHISSRKMFGGHGIYHEDCMFGLVADDTLYLKVDSQNKNDYMELDLPAFEYDKGNGKIVSMSFHLAPEFIFENPSDAAAWAGKAWEAARRSKAKSSGKKKGG